MKARINLTPEMMEKLAERQPLSFTIPPGIAEIEVRLASEKEELKDFDEVFTKIWNAILTRIEKTASSMHK